MFIKKSQSKDFSIPGGTNGKIYPSSPDGDFTLAHVSMDGFYPQKGFSINNTSKETLYILEGSFKVEVEGELFKLEKGDVIMIDPQKKYRIEGKGEALDIITPAWEKNINKIIEK